MTALGIIGLILGIIVMIVFAYWGLNAVPLSLLAGAVICIFNGINLWTGFATSWAGGLATVFSAYYILFFVSTCFANIMVKPVPAPRLPINSSTGSERSISSLFYHCSASFSATAASAFSYACLQLDRSCSNYLKN